MGYLIPPCRQYKFNKKNFSFHQNIINGCGNCEHILKDEKDIKNVLKNTNVL